MSDVTSPNLDSSSMTASNPGNSANRSGRAPTDALDNDGRGSGGGISGDSAHTGSAVDEPINCTGIANAAVNQASQTVFVNVCPSNPSARPHSLKLTFRDTPESEFLYVNIIVSWRYAIYISGLFFVLVWATYIVGAAFVCLVNDVDNHYECYSYCHSTQF
ncbi:hypothetical protein BDM02DRAFT_3191785 [Thelephora ganbajun]|uniref:Uncharacterized protein n=1 Tax=Thelephora ganbajun TaxID=370292 RepID=A0ACB6Z1T6_THEGA|nr:hypothetical protein BDM02DRAFT_3191785 [Thelephora ganbajun]